MKNTKITLDSCWYNSDELSEHKAEIKKKYNLDIEFHDGSDHYSTMTYIGTKENIKKFLEAEYIPYFDEEEYAEEVIEFLKNYSN